MFQSHDINLSITYYSYIILWFKFILGLNFIYILKTLYLHSSVGWYCYKIYTLYIIKCDWRLEPEKEINILSHLLK